VKSSSIGGTTVKNGSIGGTTVKNGSIGGTTKKSGSIGGTTKKSGSIGGTTVKNGSASGTTTKGNLASSSTKKSGSVGGTTKGNLASSSTRKGGQPQRGRYDLSSSESATVLNALNTAPPGQFTGAEREALQRLANNQPLTQNQMAVALNVLGRSGMSPALRSAITHGIMDNMSTLPGGNPNVMPNGLLPGGGGVVVVNPVPVPGPVVVQPTIVDPVITTTGGTIVTTTGGTESQGGTVESIEQQTSARAVRQDRRYVRVKNDTGERLTVYLRYHTFTKEGSWKWFPENQDEAVVFELDAGQEADLSHGDWPISANRIRIWGTTASGHDMTEYRDQDLWLVEETNGERCYFASDAETFTFAFGR
jgi:hypothetical protein